MTTTVRPEVISRIRLVTRLLAFGDPRAPIPLPPFVRARRFLEHVCTLQKSGWSDVVARKSSGTQNRDHAEQLRADMFMSEGAEISCNAIITEARRVVRRAMDNGFLPAELTPRAARLATNATLALVLRDVLPESDFRALYGSFVDPRP